MATQHGIEQVASAQSVENYDEKKDASSEIVDLQAGRSRKSPTDYVSSVRERFTSHKMNQYTAAIMKFGRFVGPGTIITVAYIDPDNYQTDVASGATFQYKLLFMILVSNIVSMYLQAMSVKLGSVTGMTLAQMNRAYMPRWLNYALWVLAEASIVCTDVGQMIGTAIALNLLVPKIPLMAGCALAIADTLFILLFYRPDGSMRLLRSFEFFVTAFVLAVVVCFCVMLARITGTTAKHVMDGFLPSREIFVSEGLYQSCALLGGTIMPHTIYLGTGLCQSRLREFDIKHSTYHESSFPNGTASASPISDSSDSSKLYRPSLSAIRSCMKYSIAELCITLFVVAVFVNSAILIIAASSLSEEAGDADLFGMYDLFVSSINQSAGTIFALALLFSGISAGIVATMAGQLIMEGALNWTIRPFYRRLITRSVALIPALIVCGATGRKGVAAALENTNVVLSVALIFLTFPLIWYTSFNKYMMVETEIGLSAVTVDSVEGDVERSAPEGQKISLANNWATMGLGWFIWLLITVMNVATLTFLGMGIGGD